MLGKVKFHVQVEETRRRYEALERQFAWLGKMDIPAAYELYRNASRAALGFLVCGRTRVDKNRWLIGGSSIEEIDLFNLGGTSDPTAPRDRRAAFQETGSVLHYKGGAGWHFLMNDAWLLGGVHGGLDFHLASPRHRDNLLDPIGGYMTVTARELTGLWEFGYRFARDALGQEIAYPTDPVRARNASLQAYWTAIDRQGGGRTLDRALIDPAARLVGPATGHFLDWQKSVPGARP